MIFANCNYLEMPTDRVKLTLKYKSCPQFKIEQYRNVRLYKLFFLPATNSCLTFSKIILTKKKKKITVFDWRTSTVRLFVTVLNRTFPENNDYNYNQPSRFRETSAVLRQRFTEDQLTYNNTIYNIRGGGVNNHAIRIDRIDRAIQTRRAERSAA